MTFEGLTRVATEPNADRKRTDGPGDEDQWLNKAEFLRFLTRHAQGYPPDSKPRKFIDEYIDDLRKNG